MHAFLFLVFRPSPKFPYDPSSLLASSRTISIPYSLVLRFSPKKSRSFHCRTHLSCHRPRRNRHPESTRRHPWQREAQDERRDRFRDSRRSTWMPVCAPVDPSTVSYLRSFRAQTLYSILTAPEDHIANQRAEAWVGFVPAPVLMPVHAETVARLAGGVTLVADAETVAGHGESSMRCGWQSIAREAARPWLNLKEDKQTHHLRSPFRHHLRYSEPPWPRPTCGSRLACRF
jgi:hypothetical protein